MGEGGFEGRGAGGREVFERGGRGTSRDVSGERRASEEELEGYKLYGEGVDVERWTRIRQSRLQK